MAFAISLFGEETDAGIAEVGQIEVVLSSEQPNVLFEVGHNSKGLKAEEMETARPLHRLRGFALHCEKHGSAPTPAEVGDGYRVLEELYDGKIATQWYPHLVDHSDSDGYYIPADFTQPINAYMDGEVISIGSSHRLLAELNSIRRFLFGEDTSALGDEQQELLWAIAENDSFALEKNMWCRLRWLARNSVESNLVIRFQTSNPDFD
jgi:hypothetical protein